MSDSEDFNSCAGVARKSRNGLDLFTSHWKKIMKAIPIHHMTAVLMTAALLSMSACGGQEAAEGDLTGTVQVDGSSTVFPITEAVAEEFMAEHRQVRVTVGVSGTGGGFSKFLRGETDINDASRTIKESEIRLAEQNGVEFIELPVSYDGLAVLVSPQNDFVECLTVAELRRIWEPGSTINNWNQVRPEFPNSELTLYGPGTDSGTYDYFTEALIGESGASRSDFTASEDDNVLVQGIAGDPSALGYFGLAYYENNADRLKLVAVDDENPDNGEGCMEPTAETVENGTYAPLSRPLFIYVRKQAAADSTVNEFVHFYLENAGALAPEVGYVSMSPEAYELALERYDRGITGSMFTGGSHTGVTMNELLQREMGSVDSAPVDTTGATGDTTSAGRGRMNGTSEAETAAAERTSE